jgi:thymidine phosphorylase
VVAAQGLFPPPAPRHDAVVIDRWLEERREGREQDEAAIRGFVEGVVDGSVTRAQAAAWLAFVYLKGMSPAETVALTRAMTESGDALRWDGLEGPFVDKHSTGGVGDKVSLVLAPLWAALGKRVPMLSGRGLGITGGTLDKLEAIPGYRTDLDEPALRSALGEVGCFINGQTERVAPADRILYALRDETQTVPSIPLITASILSKKLVEGLDELVLDVKCGSGAFMATEEAARELADSLAGIGNRAGVRTTAHLTDMSQPLGCAVGNALEVREAVACLEGGGPADLRELVLRLCGDPAGAAAALDDGRALARWQAMVRAHGGDPEAPLHGSGCAPVEIAAPHAGEVRRCDAGLLGRAAFRLGAGRTRAGEPVHFGVGLEVLAKRGATVAAGEPLVRLWHDAGRGLEEARAAAAGAFEVA